MAVTLAVGALEGFKGWPSDAQVILVIVWLNGVLGCIRESRSQRHRHITFGKCQARPYRSRNNSSDTPKRAESARA